MLVEDSEPRSRRWCEQLGGHHDTTKALHRQLVSEAHEQASRIHFKEQLVMIVGRPGWHPGLMGPIAAQLVNRFERPAIAIALDKMVGTGSGRSIESFNLFEALRACEGMLVRYGGHPQACGLTIGASQVDGFRARINDYARQTLAKQRLTPRMRIDAVLTLRELTVSVAEAFETFRPFGPGNPQPIIALRDARVVFDGTGKRWVTDGDRMLKLRGRSALECPDGPCDLVATTSAADGAIALSALDVGEAGTSGRAAL
jgi:single-stranded-DNA-specific exonuclease